MADATRNHGACGDDDAGYQAGVEERQCLGNADGGHQRLVPQHCDVGECQDVREKYGEQGEGAGR
ncbi:hypothetical protein D3C80_1852760 [compost metagenome]